MALEKNKTRYVHSEKVAIFTVTRSVNTMYRLLLHKWIVKNSNFKLL